MGLLQEHYTTTIPLYKIKAVEECRQLLQNHRVALVSNVLPNEMLRHLQRNMVFDSDTAQRIRRGGKGIPVEANNLILNELLTRGQREFDVFTRGLIVMNLNLLADLLQKKHFSNIMHIIEPASKMLGHHWKRLALELGVANSIPKVEAKYVRVREQALFCLLLWEKTAGASATGRRLLEALEACDMKRAVAYVRKVVDPKGGKKKKGKKSGKKKAKKK
ncbi:uncharacterized protein LOC117109728 isoform X2 [Anneissia japonica]|uniref:uncharacterized protein LOC117109728 isoform X2 n=1 Tax=Anneissia japonica TaxID=1529436 RepID=UPI001425996C|nr:uncharacterized protein LOC117109728 isoform X2 [Anneissia japonica]